MAIAVVQLVKGTQMTSSPGTLSMTVTAGNLLHLWISYDDLGTTWAISDSKNGSWGSPIITSATGSAGLRYAAWKFNGTLGGSLTITATSSGPPTDNAIWAAIEISGQAAGTAVDGSGSNYQTSPGTATNAVTTGSITNTKQPALIVALCGKGLSPAASVGTGFTLLDTDTVTSQSFTYSSRRITTTSGTAATFTTPDGPFDASSIAVFYDEAAAGKPGSADPSLPISRTAPKRPPDSSIPIPPRVFKATGYEHSEPSSRPQTGPPRYVTGEPLRSPVVAPAGKGFDTSAPAARAAAEIASPGSDVPPPLKSKNFDVSAPLSRAAAEIASPGSDVPPLRVFTGTGFEHTEPSSRPQAGPPRHLSGEPLPAAEFLSAPVDLAWAPGRITSRPAAAPGGEPNPPRVFPPTSYEAATAPRRADTGPPRHLPADALPQIAGTVTPGTLADATTALSRAPARAPAPVSDAIAARAPAAGFDPAPAAARAAARPAPTSADGTPPSVQPPTAFEHSEPSARVQPGPPRHLPADAIPAIAGTVVPGTIADASPPAGRATTRPQPAAADIVAPRAASAGFEATAAAGRQPPRAAPSGGDGGIVQIAQQIPAFAPLADAAWRRPLAPQPALVDVAPVLVSSLAPAPGMKLWLRGDAGVTTSGGSVTDWADWSGNGNNVTQSIAGRRPAFTPSSINGLPGITFNGASGQQLGNSITNLVPSNNNRTVIAVVKAATAWSSGTVFTFRNSGADFSLLMGIGGTPYIWSNAIGVATDPGLPAINGVPTVMEQFYDNAGPTLSLNMNSAAQVLSISSLGGDSGLPGFQVGNRTGIADQPFIGDICEILVYDHVLSGAELALTRAYLNFKYFTLHLPGVMVDSSPAMWRTPIRPQPALSDAIARAATIAAIGFDATPAGARQSPRALPFGGDVPAPSVQTALAFETAVARARQLAPSRSLPGDPLPAQIFGAAGVENFPASWRRAILPAIDQPLTMPALASVRWSPMSDVALARSATRVQLRGADAIAVRAQTVGGIDTTPVGARLFRPAGSFAPAAPPFIRLVPVAVENIFAPSRRLLLARYSFDWIGGQLLASINIAGRGADSVQLANAGFSDANPEGQTATTARIPGNPNTAAVVVGSATSVKLVG